MTTTLPIRQSFGSRVIRLAQVGFSLPALRWHGAAGYPPPGFPDTILHHPQRKDPPAMQTSAYRQTVPSRSDRPQPGRARRVGDLVELPTAGLHPLLTGCDSKRRTSD